VETAIVGAGAAGLMTAITARRTNRSRSVVLLEGAARPGAKILVSGGSRCNVTNLIVSERDFWGGRAAIVRRVLAALPVPQTIAFFRELGVPLHQEADGKLFPDSNRSRDVLDALLREVRRAGAELRAGTRVIDIDCTSSGRFVLSTAGGPIESRFVVLATGGQSLPKSGSDGAGYRFAAKLGHTIVPTTPALAALLLGPDDFLHRRLMGVTHDAELTLWIDGRAGLRLRGAMLWTHFGVSGPVAMNLSRHWLRARLENRPVKVTANFAGGRSFDAVEAAWLELSTGRPRLSAQHAVSTLVPAALGEALLAVVGVDGGTVLAQLSREKRRQLIHALVEWPLDLVGTRGYTSAEATAGGVALEEVDPATMQSRVCPGLFLVGEVLDVDGRIGGFNFQWAWATGSIAGHALGGLQ